MGEGLQARGWHQSKHIIEKSHPTMDDSFPLTAHTDGVSSLVPFHPLFTPAPPEAMCNWPSITGSQKGGVHSQRPSLTRGGGRRQRSPCSLTLLFISSNSAQFTNIICITATKANGRTWSWWAPINGSPLRRTQYAVMSPPQPGPRMAPHYRCTVGVKRCSSSTIGCVHHSSMWMEALSSPRCPSTPASPFRSPRFSKPGMLNALSSIPSME